MLPPSFRRELVEALLDWLGLHGSLINLQRLRNLHKTGLGDEAVLSVVAAVILEQSIQLRDILSPTLHALHQHGLSGEYGLPRELPGDSLIPTLTRRLPEAVASL